MRTFVDLSPSIHSEAKLEGDLVILSVDLEEPIGDFGVSRQLEHTHARDSTGWPVNLHFGHTRIVFGYKTGFSGREFGRGRADQGFRQRA
eukprot:CAMPEP_0168318884 /NCGR_PEP_ID=MMETSP0213-20121227/737_1 /TAXON_ID=151035 /ORGANISM="Euplotes harpa, Strain FSP1.4" /LENGTH=89 /DNA_ID=CAMNT_0008320021 /DNA_START=196 /DNA_END=465 /DNA_ORIENTATION=-